MTKLIFFYSWPYDRSICFWLGEKWKDDFRTEGIKYEKEIQRRWNRINNKVFASFEAFGFKLPSVWQAYPVTRKKIKPFSAPLTFKISYDWDDVWSILIHELTHVEFSYPGNKKLTDKAFGYIGKTFPGETPRTRTHIGVNLLQLSVMTKVFPRKYQKMLARQKSLLGLKRAWEIIEKNKGRIDLDKPVESILNLKP